jgi:phosphatidylserine/phosphatidylglycerophosphate/cardiolipin synthase-like enzyme
MKKALTPRAIDQTIRQHLSKLRKPGVLTVRPGFQITRHRLTGKRAIVATVHTKTSHLPANQLLPRAINGVPVDVREATPHQRLRANDPAAAALTQAFGRPQDKEPTWPLEREMPSGQLLQSPKSKTQRALVDSAAQQPVVAEALAAHAAKPKTPYVPAPNQPLNPVQSTTTITAHVSPDAGFATLTTFLQGTQQSLVIGMYDFTSGPILTLFKAVLTGAKTLQMVLDNPPPNATRNQLDSQTVQELNAALGPRSKIVRALAGDDTLVSTVMFPTSYHIKVMVRDNAVLWLSSGNLNNSNQPDPASPPKTEDRDWHVIIEDKAIANLFAAYLNQDFRSAQAFQIAESPALTEAVADAAAKLAAQTTALPTTPAPTAAVAAKTFTNVGVTMTPLLTPDTLAPGTQGQYVSNMLKLIASAKKKLYVQLQYIEASSASGDYADLLQAVAARVAAGVDVRLIESSETGEQWAEKMKDSGVDLTANISLQPNVHNKGFVIDSSVVVVSSQNFSPDGIQFNRDAGVIIESAPIAQYFENVFLADWNNKAKPFVAKSAAKAKPPSQAQAKAVRKPKPKAKPKPRPKPRES